MFAVSHKHLFSKLFPVPRMMDMRAVGIDISHQTIRMVKFSEKTSGVFLDKWDEVKIPPGAIYSEEPIITSQLVRALTDLRIKHKLSRVNISMPEQEGYVFTFEATGKNDTEIRQSILFQLEENIPLKPEEAIFDYQIVKDEPLTVVVTAYPRTYIERVFGLCEKAGLIPVGFCTAGDAICHAVVPRSDLQTHLVVNFGEKNTGLYIVTKGIVAFSATLNFGAENLTSAISKQFVITEAEAEEMKRGEKDLSKKEMMQLSLAFINPISSLRDEIAKVMQYWRSHQNKERDPAKEIKTVFLCGDDAYVPGLDEYLAGMLKLPVNRSNVWVNAFSFDKTIPKIHFRESLNFPSAIGLALRSFEQKYE